MPVDPAVDPFLCPMLEQRGAFHPWAPVVSPLVSIGISMDLESVVFISRSGAGTAIRVVGAGLQSRHKLINAGPMY